MITTSYGASRSCRSSASISRGSRYSRLCVATTTEITGAGTRTSWHGPHPFCGSCVTTDVDPAEQLRRPTLHTLTALRWPAAFAVFAFHVAPFFLGTSLQTPIVYLTSAGPAGVSFFFVLSGFVLTWSRRTGDRRRDFYRRRFARIYPLHLVTWGAAGALLVGAIAFDRLVAVRVAPALRSRRRARG